MPERPILRLPEPIGANPPKAPRGGSTIIKPTRKRQGERLGPRLDPLVAIAGDIQRLSQLRNDPKAIAPDRALVFEVSGSIVEFYEQAAAIGLEYLADEEREFPADSDFQIDKKPEEAISGRVYLAMPSVQALQRLVSLWSRYLDGKRMPNGFGMWSKLFGLLREIRPWGPQDRLPPETLAYWEERLRIEPDAPVRIEVELWFRETAEIRARSISTLRTVVASLGGRTIDHSVIAAIRYDAALVDLPAGRVADLLANPVISLAAVEDIMFLRPQTMAEHRETDELQIEEAKAPTSSAPGELPPIVALIDGLPLQNHSRLAGRLIVDDPDGFEEGYLAAVRRHGTEMASLILHGDLNGNGPPLSKRLYVRPVMRPTADGRDERTPADRLVVDLIYRSIVRMKEGDAGGPPSAPSILIVNISLGDPNRPFAGLISPWARLLDYLAFRYNLLFLVSAGNIHDPLELTEFDTWTDFTNAAEPDKEQAVFRAINNNKSRRTLLSPAEAVNVLTIGAAHRDSVSPPQTPPLAADPIGAGHLPNISSALGLGFRRVIKPDLLMDGGREFVRLRSTHPLVVEPMKITGRAFGLRAAAPDGTDLDRTILTWGTSAATALTTRAAHAIHDALTDEAGGSLHADTPTELQAILVKALLVHASTWSEKWTLLEQIVGGTHYARADDVSRILGHGILQEVRSIECTAGRATFAGVGEIKAGDAVIYRIPLPSSLEGVSEYRAVTVTLAWFTPINPRHQGYRMIALEAGPGADKRYSLGVDRAKGQPSHHAIRRGTVFHDRREGDRATAYIDEGDLVVRVSARDTAGDYAEAVPYALALSLEVGVTSQLQVYDEMRVTVSERLRTAVRTT